MDKIWIVKHLRDLRSGKPETDVTLFSTEEAARDYIAKEHPDFKPWDDDGPTWVDEGGVPYAWIVKGGDEYVELESSRVR